MKNREKAETTNIVEDGITLFAVDGRYKAAHFMIQNGVRFVSVFPATSVRPDPAAS